jgi:hypothetical protein
MSLKIFPTFFTDPNLLFRIVRLKRLRGWTITWQFSMIAKALRAATLGDF